MLKYAVILLFTLSCNVSFSQSFDKFYEDDFAWNVKQIDEFIERFNNDDKTLIKQYNKKNMALITLNRERLIKSLFNTKDRSWNISDVGSFINEVTNKEKPLYLDFFDPLWYAKVNCLVIWNNKSEHAVLTLKIKRLPDESSKWVITGVEADFLREQYRQDSISGLLLKEIPPSLDQTTSLHPFSHATQFMNIDQVSADKLNIGNYFSADDDADQGQLLTFMNEIIHHRLDVKRTVSMKYYFFEVKGWAFEVSLYNRASRNSGWLISKLTKMP